MALLAPEEIRTAYHRIAPYIHPTPLLRHETLDALTDGSIIFKFEGFQKTGSFKVRGALNTLLWLQETHQLPEHVVAFSSGNHAQAVAYASQLLGVKATIFIPRFSSAFKIDATRALGAHVILTETREDAESGAQELVVSGAMLIPPFDHDKVLAGQGTSCFEALSEGMTPDAIFATIGGGGWISGTYLAAQLLCPTALVIGAEPLLANDAAMSYRTGKIQRAENPTATLADGARTPQLAERTFAYVQQLTDVIEVSEDAMLYWTRLLALHLKITAEPTSAVAAAACAQWLELPENKGKRTLVLLSGGNIDPATHQRIWQD